LEITHTLERLDLSRILGPFCSAEVSKKGFNSISEGDTRIGVGYSDSSDISKVVSILARLLLATNLAFFCNICFVLSIGYTNPAHCAVEV